MTCFLAVTLIIHIDCDILINDKSVSRVHSELIVSPLKNPSDVNSLSKLTVADKSKFGTFVNR
jgi:pSer/pThr/pTyr-binding forkhead associated (FHA) protein